MSIENTLERIAVALETIASTVKPSKGPVADIEHHKEVAKAFAEETQAKQKGIRTDKKVETPVETHTEEPGATLTDAPEIKWADVNKAFFAVLTKIKAAKGLDRAKAASATLAKKFSNGLPPTAANTDPTRYAEFLADIAALEAALTGQ